MMKDEAREALRERLAEGCCQECGHHVGKHHPAGGCDTTEYGEPEDGFPASRCTCELDFADALLPVVVAEKAAAWDEVRARVDEYAAGLPWYGESRAVAMVDVPLDDLIADLREVTDYRAALADDREGGEPVRTGGRLHCTYCGEWGHLNAPCPTAPTEGGEQ